MKKLFQLASLFIFLLIFYYTNAQSIALKEKQAQPPQTDLIVI
jgi:hypothetical protein